MKSELKPCPLCGSDVEVRRYGFEDSLDYTIICPKCPCNISGLGESREEVVVIWNNRVVENELREQLKAAQSDLAKEQLRAQREEAMKERAFSLTIPLARTLAAGSLIQHGGVMLGEIPEESKWVDCPDVCKCEKDGMPTDIGVCISCWLDWAMTDVERDNRE